MLRIFIYVAVLLGLFGGAIVYGGNAIGAWDPLPPAPTPPPAVKLDGGKQKESKEATKRSAAVRPRSAGSTSS